MKTYEEPTSSGLKWVLFWAILNFALGTATGAVVLMHRPVPLLSKTSDLTKLPPGEIYLIRGDRAGSGDWRALETAWANGSATALEVSEVELNNWADLRMKAEPGKVTEETWKTRFRPDINLINFRIDGEDLIISAQVSFPKLLPNQTYLYQVRGTLENTGQGIEFVEKAAHLGQAPVGSLPVLDALLMDALMSPLKDRAGYLWVEEHWENFQEVRFENDRLRILRGRPM